MVHSPELLPGIEGLMHELCEARGVRYLHAIQPTLHDRGSKPVTDEEFRIGIGEAGYDEAVLVGYPLLREGLAQLSREATDFVLAARPPRRLTM